MPEKIEELKQQVEDKLEILDGKDILIVEAFAAGYTAAKLNSTDSQQKAV